MNLDRGSVMDYQDKVYIKNVLTKAWILLLIMLQEHMRKSM